MEAFHHFYHEISKVRKHERFHETLAANLELSTALAYPAFLCDFAPLREIVNRPVGLTQRREVAKGGNEGFILDSKYGFLFSV